MDRKRAKTITIAIIKKKDTVIKKLKFHFNFLKITF